MFFFPLFKIAFLLHTPQNSFVTFCERSFQYFFPPFLVIWDLIQAKELYNFQDHEDEVQSLAWQHSGQLLATQCKDRQLRILDPR